VASLASYQWILLASPFYNTQDVLCGTESSPLENHYTAQSICPFYIDPECGSAPEILEKPLLTGPPQSLSLPVQSATFKKGRLEGEWELGVSSASFSFPQSVFLIKWGLFLGV
jgi:hypothetical protein